MQESMGVCNGSAAVNWAGLPRTAGHTYHQEEEEEEEVHRVLTLGLEDSISL